MGKKSSRSKGSSRPGRARRDSAKRNRPDSAGDKKLAKDGGYSLNKWVAAGIVTVLVLSGLMFYFGFNKPPGPVPPSQIDRTIKFPADEGAHKGEAMELWTFYGLFQNADGDRFGYVVSYWNTGMREVSFTDENNLSGNTFYHVTDLPTNELEPENNILAANGSLDLTYQNEGVHDRWAETDTGNQTYALDTGLNTTSNGTVILSVTIEANKDPLILGENGKIYLQDHGTVFTYSQTNVSISGRMTIDGRSYFISGYGLIMHAWGSWSISSVESWNLMLSDGVEIIISRLYEPGTSNIYLEYAYTIGPDGSYDVVLYSDVLPVAPGMTYEQFQAQNLSIRALSYWLDPTDPYHTRCYSHGWELVSARVGYRLLVLPTVENQKGTGISWIGTVTVEGSIGDMNVTGRGYVNLEVPYRSSLTISDVHDNVEVLEIPNDPVTVSATITDGIPVSSATLWYRINNGTNQTLALGWDGDVWSAAIPGQPLGTEVEYGVVAVDAAGKTAYSGVYSYRVKI